MPTHDAHSGRSSPTSPCTMLPSPTTSRHPPDAGRYGDDRHPPEVVGHVGTGRGSQRSRSDQAEAGPRPAARRRPARRTRDHPPVPPTRVAVVAVRSRAVSCHRSWSAARAVRSAPGWAPIHGASTSDSTSGQCTDQIKPSACRSRQAGPPITMSTIGASSTSSLRVRGRPARSPPRTRRPTASRRCPGRRRGRT